MAGSSANALALKKAPDGGCQRNTTAPEAMNQLTTVSALARPMPGYGLVRTPSAPSVCRPNRAVPVTRAALFPSRQARAIQSHSATSVSDTTMARAAATARAARLGLTCSAAGWLWLIMPATTIMPMA